MFSRPHAQARQRSRALVVLAITSPEPGSTFLSASAVLGIVYFVNFFVYSSITSCSFSPARPHFSSYGALSPLDRWPSPIPTVTLACSTCPRRPIPTFNYTFVSLPTCFHLAYRPGVNFAPRIFLDFFCIYIFPSAVSVPDEPLASRLGHLIRPRLHLTVHFQLLRVPRSAPHHPGHRGILRPNLITRSWRPSPRHCI